MITWLRSWFAARRASAAMRRATVWEENARRLSMLLDLHMSDLRLLRRGMETLSERVQERLSKLDDDLRVAVDLYKQHEAVVEQLRNENRILADTVIPTLVAGHKLVLQRYDAETAIEVRRQVAAGAVSND